MNKTLMGWNATLESKWQQHRDFTRGHVARVLSSNHSVSRIQLGADQFTASIPPEGSQLRAYPVPGDWCVVASPDTQNKTTRILDVLERRRRIMRKRVGRHVEPQTLATHVDVGLILTARREDFNWNRIDRYLTMIFSENITPIICLTKCDLDPTTAETEAIVKAAFPHVEVVSLSVKEGLGLSRLTSHLGVGRTSTLLGSSGVGKSTLTNWMLGHDRRATQSLRNGIAKGRHTTSNGRMFQIPTIGWIIDLPGLRELEPWDAYAGIEENFSDIILLAKQCRFSNCQHDREVGCAVQRAIEHGLLPRRMFDNYHRMLREQDRQNRLDSRRAKVHQKRRDKSMAKLIRARLKAKQARS